ncbi:MAG: dihydroorotate dehydrogenase-like protein [Spirochaetia bacterium]|jgi:dihydroorotate dehydrogenase (fumarate)|nr:dihydroorotate dehydrogenase-like protein [Spirochaetia bacterium]
MSDLSTSYMGLKLKNPIIAASSSLTGNLENIKKCEDAGAGAVVLKSLFEEQITSDKNRMVGDMNFDAYTDAYDFFNASSTDYYLDEYLGLVEDAKESLSIPVIASVNCVSPGQWTDYAERFENIGADALELNMFILPSNISTDGKTIEDTYIKILEDVKKNINIPVSIKIGYHFSGMGNFINRAASSGAQGIVLFNRFYKIDIDIEHLNIKSSPIISDPSEIHLALQWIALMSGEISADFSAATGVHYAEGAIKHLLAGASSVQLCSTLLKNGVSHITEISSGIEEWMDRKNYTKIADFKGILSQENSKHPEAYERSQFIKSVVGLS